MPRQRLSLLPALVVLAVSAVSALSLAGCNRGPTPDAAKKAAASKTLLLSPEDLLVLSASDQAQGPVITGTIQPEKRADLRAEVSAIVLQVLKENGEAVRQGALLVRLDDTSIRDGLRSAEETARAARQAVEQAQRQVERLKTLQLQGMTAMQALEDAEVRRNTAQSDYAAADARVVAARQQLRRTEVRAPFDGVTSERKVSSGDTAAIGKELIKVIDPRTMRFEGLVSADRMHELKLGQRVTYRVNGYPQTVFAGTVKRIDAAANPVTRQVEVLVELAANERPKVSGLYAEGRVETGSQSVIMLPEAAIVRSAQSNYVWRLSGGKAEAEKAAAPAVDKIVEKAPNGTTDKGQRAINRILVQLGDRDDRSGDYPVRAGIAEGDRILRNPNAQLVEGQLVELAKPGGAAPDLATSGTPASTTSTTATK
jgi:RND family efflux transporter MFP subunit